MTESENIPKGVVIDEPMANALLYAAIQERLIDDDPNIGNGFVGRLLSSTPSKQLVNAAYEQIILGGKIYIPFWLPPEWKGDLFERQTVVPYRIGVLKDVITVEQMPSALVLGMLESRNIIWSQTELETCYKELLKAGKDWEAVAGGKRIDEIKAEWAFNELLKKMDKEKVSGEYEHTIKQLEAWKVFDDKFKKFKPVWKCEEAYARVVNSSIQLSALSSLPVLRSNVSAIKTGHASDVQKPIALLRFTCEAFRRVPIGNTLRETINLAKSPEAKALRLKLVKWTDELRKGELELTEVILPEIEKARKSLKTTKTFSQVGEYSTWIGVPVAIAGAFLAGPVVTGIGISMSVVGGLALTGQKLMEGLNRWAMFGQE